MLIFRSSLFVLTSTGERARQSFIVILKSRKHFVAVHSVSVFPILWRVGTSSSMCFLFRIPGPAACKKAKPHRCNASFTLANSTLAAGRIRSPINDRTVLICCYPGGIRKCSTRNGRVTRHYVRETHHLSGHIGTDRNPTWYTSRESITLVLRVSNLETHPLSANRGTRTFHAELTNAPTLYVQYNYRHVFYSTGITPTTS